MTPRHLLMAAGLAGGAALLLFGERGAGDTGVVQAVPRASPALPRPAPPAAQPDEIALLADRAALIGGASDAGASDALFNSRNWAPVQVAAPAAQTTAPPPPQAPPLPFTYIGKKLEDQRWEVYLAQGEQTHAVHAGDTVQGQYRIESIRPPVLTITYLPLKQMQTIHIGEAL